MVSDRWEIAAQTM